MREIVRAVDQAGDPSLWDQIIIQIYHEEMHDWVREEAPVKNWIFTLYQLGSLDYHRIGRFCRERNIPVVTMDATLVSAETSRILRSYGCLVYAHTVNRLTDMIDLSWLTDGYYSDCITPSQLMGVLPGRYQQAPR